MAFSTACITYTIVKVSTLLEIQQVDPSLTANLIAERLVFQPFLRFNPKHNGG